MQQIAERATAKEAINQSIRKLKSFGEFLKLDDKQQVDIIAPFERLIKEIELERFIGNIRTKAHSAITDMYQRQLELMSRWATPPPPPVKPGIPPEPPKPRVVYVRKDNVKVNFPKPSLETRQDVEDYLAALRIQYLRIIDEEKRISL